MKKSYLNKVKVFAPATIGNVSCGFDILGLCLDKPGDVVTVELVAENKILLKKIDCDDGKLPFDPLKNTASVAVREYLKHVDVEAGIAIEIKKGLPLAGGMGSSGASAVGALVAVNRLLGDLLRPIEMLPFAMKAEEAACGSAHADNVAPALLGGLVLIRGYDPIDVIKLPFELGIFIVLIHPHLIVRTEEARRILPDLIPLKDAVTQMANIATFVSGLYEKDISRIGKGLKDVIAEPSRKNLFPFFDHLKEIAKKNGCVGFGISGSGPSMFTFAPKRYIAEKFTDDASSFFSEKNIKFDVYISKINNDGPRILEEV